MRKSLITLLILAVLTACNSSSSTDPGSGDNGSGGTTTLVTVAELSGGSLVYWFGTCTPMAFGAATTGMSYNTTLGFHLNNTFDYQLEIFSDTTCGNGSGGEIFSYDMQGSYAINGAATAVKGATQLSFTRSSEVITMYAANNTYMAQTWAGYLNSYCSGGATPAFNPAGTSAQDPFGFICSHTGTAPIFTFPNFPNSNATTYNVVTLNTAVSPQTLTVSLPANLWFPGNTGYPASAAFVLTHQ